MLSPSGGSCSSSSALKPAAQRCSGTKHLSLSVTQASESFSLPATLSLLAASLRAHPFISSHPSPHSLRLPRPHLPLLLRVKMCRRRAYGFPLAAVGRGMASRGYDSAPPLASVRRLRENSDCKTNFRSSEGSPWPMGILVGPNRIGRKTGFWY